MQKIQEPQFNTVVFDCDSTLCEIEGIDELARKKGLYEQIACLTALAMEGSTSFEDVLQKRLELIKPIIADLKWLGKRYIESLLIDAKETVKTLQGLGIKVYILSCGYKIACDILACDLGIPTINVFAIDLLFDQTGNYQGLNKKSPLTKDYGKVTILQQLRKQGKTLFVGDGVTDLAAKEAVDLFVGFGGIVCRPVVKNNADIFISEKSLLPILDLIYDIDVVVNNNLKKEEKC